MKAAIFALILVFSLSLQAAETVRVVSVKGLVSYNGEYIKKGEQLEPGHLLDASGENSFAVIEYPGGRKLQVRSGRARIYTSTAKESQVELIAGKLFGWFLPAKKEAKRKPFRIKTRGVTAGVRGTKFMIEEKPEKTYLCVCEGEVAIQKGEQEVALKKGFDLWDKAGASSLKQPKYAQTRMLQMVADSVKEMGGETEAYWQSKDWPGAKAE